MPIKHIRITFWVVNRLVLMHSHHYLHHQRPATTCPLNSELYVEMIKMFSNIHKYIYIYVVYSYSITHNITYHSMIYCTLSLKDFGRCWRFVAQLHVLRGASLEACGLVVQSHTTGAAVVLFVTWFSYVFPWFLFWFKPDCFQFIVLFRCWNFNESVEYCIGSTWIELGLGITMIQMLTGQAMHAGIKATWRRLADLMMCTIQKWLKK